MCLATLQAFRVERLVYGTTNPRLGAVESAMAPPPSAESHPYAPPIKVSGGVLAEDASNLMRAFFRRARERRPYAASSSNRGAVPLRGPWGHLKAALRRLTR